MVRAHREGSGAEAGENNNASGLSSSGEAAAEETAEDVVDAEYEDPATAKES